MRLQLTTTCFTAIFISLSFGPKLSAQTSDWVTAHQQRWNAEPEGIVSATYLSHYYTAAGEWNGNPIALWANDSNLWVVEWRLSKIFGYNLASGKRDSDKDFGNFALTGNRSARGAWSDGNTMWVTDEFVDKLFAYDLKTQERLPSLDVDTLKDTGNESPTGLWSDGKIMWIADDGDDKIYAYEFGTWLHLPERDIDTLKAAGNTGVADIWSDGTTMWVAEVGHWTAWGGWSEGKLFAYDLGSGVRLPQRDIDNQTIQSAGVKSPSGIWSNGGTLWVSDRPGHKMFLFDLKSAPMEPAPETESPRDTLHDLRNLGPGGNTRPTQLWSNGNTLWVADNDDSVIYAYDFITRERQLDKDISLLLDSEDRVLSAAGLWSDGENIWILDWHTLRVVAFDLETQQRQPEKDVNALIESNNHHPSGMWSDGEILWVLDSEDAAIYAYDLASAERRSNMDWANLAEHGNSSPRGIWSDGVTVWVGDWKSEKVYAYQWSDRTRTPAKDLNKLVSAGNLSPAGLWSNGQHLWISDLADATIYRYPISSPLPEDPTLPLPSEHNALTIRKRPESASGWVIQFTGVLKSSALLSGPFEIVDGARSPFDIPNEGAQRFFIAEAE